MAFKKILEPIDLSKWVDVTLPFSGTEAAPIWNFNSTNTTVTQIVNGRPAILLSDIDCVNNVVNGSFSVDTIDDDDFIGFVFGYKDPGHFYLFDWKQTDQSDSTFGTAKCGMSIKAVSTKTTLNGRDFWNTTGTDKVKLLYHNNIRYSGKTDYNFTLNFTDDGAFDITVKQGENVLDHIAINDDTYTSGKFGFYNYSQVMATYRGFTIDVLPPKLEVISVGNAKVGDTITADIVIRNAINICAEDINIAYDTAKLKFVSGEGAEGIGIYKEDASTDGARRYITASLGKTNAANGDKNLIKLSFKAIATGDAKIDIVKGLIADNSTLEMEISSENCGEKIIAIEAREDVNRLDKYTLLDLGIDAWYYGDAAADTDTALYNADQVVNGKIDDDDLNYITDELLKNSNYQGNSAIIDEMQSNE